MKTITTAAIAAMVLCTGVALAADPGPSCEAAKLGAAGKYAACRLGVEKKATLKAVPPDFTKCDEAQLAAWSKIEAKYGSACPTTGDQAAVQAAIKADTDAIEASLDASLVALATQYPCGGSCWGAISGSGLQPGASFSIYAPNLIGSGVVAPDGTISGNVGLSCGAGWSGLHISSTNHEGEPITSNSVDSPCM